jgi:hypothetical protein
VIYQMAQGDPLTSPAVLSERSLAILSDFDMTIERAEEMSSFRPWVIPPLPDEWGIGLIVGSSGSGKSLIVRDLGGEDAEYRWDHRPIIDHFDSPDRLMAVGLNDVPAWIRPFQVLSNGQKFRANMAKHLHDGAIVDEFTSVVSRTTAQSASTAIRRYVDRRGITGMVLASCHHDVEEWLVPDWVIDTDMGVLRSTDAERKTWHLFLQPPVAELSLF